MSDLRDRMAKAMIENLRENAGRTEELDLEEFARGRRHAKPFGKAEPDAEEERRREEEERRR